MFGNRCTEKHGIYVAKVYADSGLKEGDIITKIDDEKVQEDTELRSYLYEHKKPGDNVNLTIERKGKTQSVDEERERRLMRGFS